MALVDFILVLHGLATCVMAGLCWCVQVVHYPLMGRVPSEVLKHYAAEHARRITWFVAPARLVEAATAGLLLVMAVVGHGPASGWSWAKGDWRVLVGAGVLAAIWVSTFAVLVPLHGRLQRTGDAGLVRRMVMMNWPRTVLWTVRAVLALLVLGARG
jgi:hypothetical protein